MQSSSRLHFEIECLRQYAHMLAPYLEKAAMSHRQMTLLWAMGYMGPASVANLAHIAGVDLETAMNDIRALERNGLVTLETPPTRFATPIAEKTDRYAELRHVLAPVLRKLEYPMWHETPDPARPWQGPLRPI